MTRPEITPAFHPDDDQLDRYRAGLLDGTRAAETLAAHLAECAHCRARLERWARLARVAFAAEEVHDEALRRAWREGLAQARRRRERRAAVTAQRPQRLRFVPALALAAAVAVLAVGLAFKFLPATPEAPSPVQTAATEAGPPTAAAAPADLLADLDFYLWLSNHEPAVLLNPGSS
jgi:anti-sigma factor RsiW